MDTPLVLIAGAGPTGMTAAIELKRFGLNVRIIDKADHLAQHSQALIVQARTLEQLQRYGLANAAVDRGHKITRGNFFSDGKKIATLSLDQIPSRYPFALLLPQSETEAILNQHMESLGVHTERGVELLAVNPQPNSVNVRLRHPDGHDEQLTPRWIIACDGAHSTVRQKLGIPFEGTGIPMTFFLGDFEIDGPDAPHDELSMHFHHGNFIFMARLSDKLTRLIVAQNTEAKNSQQADGNINPEALNHRDLTIQDFQNAADKLGVRIWINSAAWMTPFNVNDRIARKYRVGNVFLAGDASHIHSPAGGQGMNTGMQDVANLAWKLAVVVSGAGESLLNSYEEERGIVGKQLLARTERLLKLGTATNPVVENLRDNLMPIVTKIPVLQQSLLGFISETDITYRGSSAVVDRGGSGELHAGDRMPDLAVLNYEGMPSLLSHWTRAEHLAILLDAEGNEAAQFAASFPHIQTLSIRISDLDHHGQHLVGEDAKLFILRPDGYIGYRGRIEQRYFWEFYGEQLALAPPDPELIADQEALAHP